MQIYAYDTQGNLLHASSAQRGNIFVCPECHSFVRPRGGKFKQSHYYHSENTSCGLGGKSLIHLHIQNSIKKMLHPETIYLEHRFPEIGRIADVVWPEKKLIFEVQVSPISAEEVSNRMQDYLRIGYQVIWILHDRQFNRSRLSVVEAKLRVSPHYFTNINFLGLGGFYDQYSKIHFKKRVQRSARFPIHFKNVMSVNVKQLSRQFPEERKKWNLSFEGDLFHQRIFFQQLEEIKRSVYFTALVKQFCRALLNLFLEKTTF